jgi:two-component system, LytTR family, sensor kinase
MLLISLFFLFVYIFGASAYGAAALLSIRRISPVWGGPQRDHDASAPPRMDRAGLALFIISAVWFVLHSLIEFRNLTGSTERGLLDLATFMVFLFPPAIMHTVYAEAQCDGAAVSPVYGRLLAAMYVVSPALLIYMTLAVLGLVPRLEPFGPWIGAVITGLFALTSVYSSALMLRMPRRERPPEQLRLRNVMIFLFVALTSVFVALIFMRQEGLLIAILNRVTRTSPIFFLIASVYYQSRFDFYDLVVKRAAIIMLSIVVVGSYLAVALQWMDRVPAGPSRPWLLAVALAPVAMVMPWLVARVEGFLDRMWLGRKFTPVEAVTQVLAAMQPATDERALIEAADARLSEIFNARIAVLVGSRAVLEPAVRTEIRLTSPVTGAIVRIAVLNDDRSRRFLSEDLQLLRLVGGVFAFMLENIRLQTKRVEQEQLANELRLQSSRSELKALRAQINPHFLFNALNAIASLIHTDPARADEVVEQLAEVFRYTLRRSESEWAPLDQELMFARAYLDVEQARFGQRLSVTIDSDHGLPAPLVPSMLLQTLIENAVKHGVSQARDAGRIEVIARTTPEQVLLEVRNTGPAHDADRRGPRDGEGFGLHSVRGRLHGHFGDRASFALLRDESSHLTVARIAMPHVKVAA